MPDTEVIRKSVTRDDYAEDPRSGVIHYMVPYWPADVGALPPDPPPYWSFRRDAVLRSTAYQEDMWAGAISIAVTKMASMSWEIDSQVPLRAKRAQDLFLASLTVDFFAKHLQDFLCTDNGVFTEIVRATRAAGSRIIGLVHLDSLRCTRTGDPDVPVIYRDRMGREHEMKAHQVIAMSDMPDPGETFFGVGHCAAARAYRTIYKLASIERYVGEKVSGRRPLAIHFVNNVSPNQLENARLTAEQESSRKGLMVYMGAIIVPILDAEKLPGVATVPLAELPDGFNRKEEFDIAVLTYANNLGMDVQDLQPLTGQPLGTGAQSQVLEEKGKGKGLVAWRKAFVHDMNEMVLDEVTTMLFVEKDYRDMERKAQVSKARAEIGQIRVGAGITTGPQELQVLVDEDELPKEFLPVDITGDESLSDTEKPEGEEDEQPPPEPPEQQPEGPPEKTEKSLSDPADLIEQEMDAAVTLYQEVSGGD